MKLTLTRAAVIGVVLTALVFTAEAQQFPNGGVPRAPAAEAPDNPLFGQLQHGSMMPPGFGGMWRGKYHPEEMELTRQANDLVRKLGEAKGDAEKEKIKTKLSEVLEKQFDIRQKRHTSEIEALENQVKKLKELVQKRQENRKEIVSKRLDQLQREALGLGW
jgi:Spy/CpxP family protein refolding chaperone